MPKEIIQPRRAFLRATAMMAAAALIPRNFLNASQGFVAASSQGLNYVPSVTALPISISLWAKPTSIIESMCCFNIESSVDDGHFLLITSTKIRLGSHGVSGPLSVNSLSAGNWYHIAAVLTSTTNRALFLDNSKTTDATSAPVGAFTRGGIGCFWAGSVSAPWNGLIANVGLWNAALTDDEITSLSKGISAKKVRPSSLVDQWPLVGGVLNGIKGTVATNNNSSVTNVDHPRIYR
jgi:hypothetical protein